MEKVKEFLETVKSHPRGKELVEELGRPKSDTEMINGYLSIAKELNFSITEEELVEGLKSLMREQKAKSEEASTRVGLSDEELEGVAGGAMCEDTYSEGEWCWATDSCSFIINYYSNADYYYQDPNGEGRDSWADPREGDEDYVCENLADWDIIG